MRETKSEREITVVLPDALKAKLIGLGAFPHAHFLSKAEALRGLSWTYDDTDALLFAGEEGMSFDKARNLFSYFPTLRDNFPPSLSFAPVEELFKAREEALAKGLLGKPDPLIKAELTRFPLVILGYGKEDADLFGLLKSNGISFTLGINADYGLGKEDVSPILISRFDDSFLEISLALENISAKILSLGSLYRPSNFLIACPSSYNFRLSQLAQAFGIPLNIADTPLKTLDPIKKLADEYGRKGTYDSLAELKGGKFDRLVSQVYQTLAVTEPIKDRVGLRLCQEYLASKLSGEVSLPGKYAGIRVVNSLQGLKPVPNLFVLGLSENLVPTAKDNGLVPDKIKPLVSYGMTAVEKNIAKLKRLKEAIGLSKNVWLSRALADSFGEYPQGFFADGKNFTEASFSLKSFESHGLPLGEGRADLGLYLSLMHERYVKIGASDELAERMAQISPGSDRLYLSYDNDFDDDPKTQEYFRSYFKAGVTLSHSTLDAYQVNPFSYFCGTVLNIRAPSSFRSITGQLLHAFAEERDGFDFDKEATSLTSGFKDPDMGDLEVRYFLEKAYKQFKSLVLPDLKQAEKDEGFTLIKPKGDRDEFGETVPLGNGLKLTVKYDAVYRVGTSDSLIVDFKTASKADSYVSLLHALVGRTLQLPLYVFAFPYIKDKEPQLKDLADPIGAFIVLIQSHDGLRINKKIFTGFRAQPGAFASGEKDPNFVFKDTINEKTNSDKVKKGNEALAAFKKQADSMAEGLDLTGFDISGFGGDVSKMFGSSLGERMVAMAGLTLFSCYRYLREGRLKTKTGVRWFPVYEVQYPGKGAEDKESLDSYDDISYARPEQRHFIYPLKGDKLPTTWNDFDNVDESGGEAASELDDDDDDVESDEGD